MMTSCYVFAQGAQEAESTLRSRLTDGLTPFFKADGAREMDSPRSGGSLTKRIAQSISADRGDVVILYGGKGSGKSTFLRRILYHDPPPELQLHAFPIIVDFLQSPQTADDISQYVWQNAVRALDQDGILTSSIEQIIELFEDRFQVAQRQDLSGYGTGGSDYIRERNRLVSHWKEDKIYVTRRLQAYWKARSKGLVIAFDNTDQLPPRLQDHCFLTAQNVARELSCVVIISMREERYCRARTVGVLDAYHNSGFHLAAPDLQYVFTKRLKFLLHDLTRKNRDEILKILPSETPFEEITTFFFVCLRQFNDTRNAMNRFLRECSRDNTRLALEFFRQYVTSGYTHIEEMVKHRKWTVIDHQVIKPMMIPERYNYDENKSLIPNIFQCRSAAHGSHFTAIRILRMLKEGIKTSPEMSGYWRVDALGDEYENKFAMRGDYESCLDILLRYGLIEANNRLDTFSVEKTGGGIGETIYADEIRITAFGLYMNDYLSGAFTYLDLVSLDCGISDEHTYNEFCVAASRERALGEEGDRATRLKSRIQRAQEFVSYLKREEDREIVEFALSPSENIMNGIEGAFLADIVRVRSSAARNTGERDESGPLFQASRRGQQTAGSARFPRGRFK